MPQQSRPYQAHHGEFLYPTEIRKHTDIEASPKALKGLGHAGLLFAQVESRGNLSDATLVSNLGNFTLHRYHVRYALEALASLGDPEPKPKTSAGKLIEYANANTDTMAEAINKFYDGIFAETTSTAKAILVRGVGWEEAAEGENFNILSMEQALGAIGLSYHKAREYRVELEGSRKPVWCAEKLAEVYGWNVPGGPETHEIVRDGLSDLALQYTVILGEDRAAD